MNAYEFINIENLNINDKSKLIDLIENMPQSLNKFVKMNISKPSFYKSIVNNNTILLNKNNSIEKYLDRNINVRHVEPKDAMFQSLYSEIISDIDIINLSSYVKSKFKTILDAPSFDDECLARIEISISSLICDVNDNEILLKVLHLINTKIIPYKLMGHDFYTYLSLHDSRNYIDYNFDIHDCNHLTDMHNLLINTIYKGKISYGDYNNIASLIYGYFKEIGLSSVIEKYDLLNRFLIPLKLNPNKECISIIKELVLDKINSDISIGDNIHSLFNVSLLNTLNNSDVDLSVNSIAKEVDSTTIVFRDMDLIPDIEDMRLQLSVLNKNTVSMYIDNIPKNYNIFSLTENDICYLRDIDTIKIGTVYDNSTYGIRYIAYYNNEFYLLFKNNIYTTIIYGISLSKDSNGDRKILEIKKSKNFTYKYISTI